MQIHTDREIAANKPDIMIKDHKNKTCKLIDVAININERQKNNNFIRNSPHPKEKRCFESKMS